MYCNNSEHTSHSFMCNNIEACDYCVNCKNCDGCSYCIDCENGHEQSFCIGEKEYPGETEFLEEVHKRYPKIYNYMIKCMDMGYIDDRRDCTISMFDKAMYGANDTIFNEMQKLF